MADTPEKLDRTTFRLEVIQSLHHLFNPAELRQSALLAEYGFGNSQDGPAILRRIFLESIETLKPDGLSSESKAWLLYQVLHFRFSENIAQKEVAGAMSKSIRQLRRIENQAIEVLVDLLWNRLPLLSSDRKNLSNVSEMPSSTQEITQLEQVMPTDAIHLKNLVEGVLATLLPVSKQLNIELQLAFPSGLPVVSGKAVALRQGLLTLLVPLLSQIGGGKLQIGAEEERSAVSGQRSAFSSSLKADSGPRKADSASYAESASILVQAFRAGSPAPETIDENDESVGFARMLIQSAGGTMDIARQSRPGGHTLLIKLPALPQIKILAIDDNADVLQLMQRYTWNTRFNLAVLKDTQHIMADVEALSPLVIILDVMMPDIDGWELLGRLRAHPQTSAIAIIVCTILPQEALALALGAAGFLRKPVSRKAFLEALDLQVARLESGSQ